MTMLHTASVTLHDRVAVGNMIVASIDLRKSNRVVTITDTLGTSYQSVAWTGGQGGWFFWLWYWLRQLFRFRRREVWYGMLSQAGECCVAVSLSEGSKVRLKVSEVGPLAEGPESSERQLYEMICDQVSVHEHPSGTCFAPVSGVLRWLPTVAQLGEWLETYNRTAPHGDKLGDGLEQAGVSAERIRDLAAWLLTRLAAPQQEADK